MADRDIRVRFAPSPTGYLHVGGVRTALFNWLYARRTGGKFLLRIEDTDRERSSEEHTAVILDGLRWLGLEWDEDVVFQGAGLERHRKLADQLADTDHVYEDGGALRFRMPDETIAWDDFVHDTISFEGSDINDWVILRSDRTPTYNFSVVADDIHMGITHVMRGDDHISNTPKQIAVYRALGITPPAFGHVPNVHGPDGKKLSKRHGATAIGDYRSGGFLPTAMVNFLALLGWNPGDDRELFFTLNDLIAAFSLENVQRKSAVFDIKKLEWMNGQHISQCDPDDLVPLVAPMLENTYEIDPTTIDAEAMRGLIRTVGHRSRVIPDLARQIAVRLDSSFIDIDEKAEKYIAKDPEGYRHALEQGSQRLSSLDDGAWTADALEVELRALAESLGVGLGKVMQPIRVALLGTTVSEPVNELLWVVGKKESLRRMEDRAVRPLDAV